MVVRTAKTLKFQRKVSFSQVIHNGSRVANGSGNECTSWQQLLKFRLYSHGVFNNVSRLKDDVAMTPPKALKLERGFTLVITLTLMILLTLLAVGLLSLSTITMRSAGRSADMVNARANARMALQMAIGELQRSMGPDRAVSANSELLATSGSPGKPNTMGAWKSWSDFSPLKTMNYDQEKRTRFDRWLVSTSNPDDALSRDFTVSPWPTDGGTGNLNTMESVELVGKGSLGVDALPAAKARAGLVKLKTGTSLTGAYAWHVSDESLKARINSYRDPGAAATLLWKKRALLTGQRPNIALVKDETGKALEMPKDATAADYALATAASAKLVDLKQTELYAVNNAKVSKLLRNDVTPYSLGLLTNAREGGLKRDLSSVFPLGIGGAALPDEFRVANARVYKSTLGISNDADPFWSNLADYYNTYLTLKTKDTNPTYDQSLSADIPVDLLVPPTHYFAGPVIAKVEILFSYVTRDAHGGWPGQLHATDSAFNYMGHLIYAPLVTLHNPYNVSISFDMLKLDVNGVPVGFQLYHNNVAQSAGLIPLDQMYVNQGARDSTKTFSLKIGNWSAPTSSVTSGPIVMKPGQTLMCSPLLDPTATFNSSLANENTPGRDFFDYKDNLTRDMRSTPGFYGRAIGFDIDWLNPQPETKAASGRILLGLDKSQQADRLNIFGLRSTDTMHIEYGLVEPMGGQTPTNKGFTVDAEITSNSVSHKYGGLTFNYSLQADLDRITGKQIYRYPATGEINAVAQSYVSNDTALADHSRALSVAVFSAYARTTNGGVYETGIRTKRAGGLNALRDGQVAGKPFLYHNPARPVVKVNLNSEKMGSQSHEMNFQPFASTSEADTYFPIDARGGNRTPHLTGNSTTRGIKSGSYLEIQTGPMQTIADFRRSNAFSSGYMPHFAQPVANSSVSPLMKTTGVVEANRAIANYQMLDHSVLANHAFYDRFYFSTLADDDAVKVDTVFDEFMNSKRRLISQMYEPYLPAGRTVSSIKASLYSGGKPSITTYKKTAQYQMVRGSFNVNSTSVRAWKAQLASLDVATINTLWARNGALEAVTPTTDLFPIPGMTLPNAAGTTKPANATKIDDAKTNEWDGYRELKEADIQTLAEKIVDEVKLRGPFLSLSEFVNRRIGANSELTRVGALQAAINKSKINDAIFKTQVPITAADVANPDLYAYSTIESVEGNPAEGAPSWINQGELMRIIEPTATVRADTFVIRTCGVTCDAQGKETARAYAEAVVQRVPEYVDTTDAPDVNVYDTTTTASAANKTFGRQLKVVSFRWLSPDEI